MMLSNISTSRGVQTRLKDKDSDVEKRLVQVFANQPKSYNFLHFLSQVEKISKLILGEIRQIRQIIETESYQVSPAELPTTNSNGAIFTLPAVVKNGIEERPPCNFDRQEKSGDLEMEEKLRAEPELIFCCCSWPRTRLL